MSYKIILEGKEIEIVFCRLEYNLDSPTPHILIRYNTIKEDKKWVCYEIILIGEEISNFLENWKVDRDLYVPLFNKEGWNLDG